MSPPSWKLMNEQELTELFGRLEMPNPEAWAHSQITEGAPQLARYLFVRQALRKVISPVNRSWISEARPKKPDEPGAEIAPAIDRILAMGAQVEDLTTIVRAMQRRFLVEFCALLDDPGVLESEVSDIRWRLFLVDENDIVIAPMTCLLATLLKVDPTIGSLQSANGQATNVLLRPASESARRALESAALASGSIKLSVEWSSMSELELAELFRKLGANEPESWAHSQIAEGIPQLPRFLFLRQAWRQVVSPDDRNWLSELHQLDWNGAAGEISQALDRLVDAGAQVEDLTTVVRIMQWHLLAGMSVLLDQPWDLDSEISDTDIWWGLALVDQNDAPLVPIDGLIESVLETDPTGLEMRPPTTVDR